MIYNGDFETILNSTYPFIFSHQQCELKYYDCNGDGFVVNYVPSNHSSYAVLIIHGWWGSFYSPIIQRYSHAFKKLGYSIVCLNLKDHIKDNALSNSIFSFGDISYIDNYINYIKNQHQKIILLGFSFGANIALRLKNLNEFDRVILISPVFNISSAFHCIEKKQFTKLYYYTNGSHI